MKTRVTNTPISGLAVINIDHVEDERGFFIESWNKRDFAGAGLEYEFVQDSHSRSVQGVIRGLHYQDMRSPLVKLVRCSVGRVLDVAVDLRRNSSTFGQWFSIELSAENKTQLLIPIGCAHGFAALSDVCEIQYKQTDYYGPEVQNGIAWDDPDLAIPWPFPNPILSKRDQNGLSLKEYMKQPAFL